MKKDPVLVLKHMSDSISYTDAYTFGETLESFLAENNKEKQDTVFLLLEIISKAARYVPVDFRHRHQQIQWEMIDQVYFSLSNPHLYLDLEFVWAIVNELPQLKREIDKIRMNIG